LFDLRYSGSRLIETGDYARLIAFKRYGVIQLSDTGKTYGYPAAKGIG